MLYERILRVIFLVSILIIPSISSVAVNAVDAVEYHAVLIGINAYTGSYLPYSVREIQNFKSTLLKCGNWVEPNIKVLLDGNATKRNIESAIEWLAEEADDNDVSLFYFAGHGGRDHEGEFIMSYDKELHDTEFAEYLNDIHGVVIVVIDACNSGGFIEELQSSNRVILTACRADERTYQVEELKSGIFGYYLNLSLSWFTKRVETTYLLTKVFSMYYSGGLGNNSEYLIHPQMYDGTKGFTKLIDHHPYMDRLIPQFTPKHKVLWRMGGMWT